MCFELFKYKSFIIKINVYHVLSLNVFQCWFQTHSTMIHMRHQSYYPFFYFLVIVYVYFYRFLSLFSLQSSMINIQPSTSFTILHFIKGPNILKYLLCDPQENLEKDNSFVAYVVLLTTCWWFYQSLVCYLNSILHSKLGLNLLTS